MNEFESRLRNLPLRAPSSELDSRVLGQEMPGGIEKPVRRLAVPLSGAAAAALLTGLVGFFLGTAVSQIRDGADSNNLPLMTTEVIYESPGNSNPFDFTIPFENFPAGDLKTELFVSKGSGR